MSGVVALATTVALCTPAGPAHADDPPFVGWSEVLPPLATIFDPGSSDDCAAGRPACVRQTIRDMENRFDPLAETCDHDAVFSLAYLRTTEAFYEASETLDFFNDPRRINHQAVAFAQMYFDAYDDWSAGQVGQVAPAWRVAFRSADDRAVSGSGDLLLGMNAHVNRDLPFVLVATGMVGSKERKHDHDQVNRVLNHVVEPLMAELAARFDPAIANAETPYGLGYTALLQLLVEWRENAYRQAERLASAPDQATRDQVAAQIEASAEAQARAIVTGEAYHPPLTSTTARDDYCSATESSGS
jgi:hypothetical protein